MPIPLNQSGPLSQQPYQVGQIYNRREDIHARFKGQERGGIATPAGAPYVFLFTGEQGDQYGYQDGMRPDGIFEYTGEGQAGPMSFIRGNKAIRDHAADGKELLLFEAQKAKGRYRFLGSFGSQGYELRPGKDQEGGAREIIVFHLVPIEVPVSIQLVAEESALELISGEPQTLEELRAAAYAAGSPGLQTASEASKTVYARSAKVKKYVLARAKGICESCQEPAPFIRTDGTPYLEPHHTTRLADSGPDHPRWVAAICPTCHRNIHYGKDGAALNAHLQEYLGVIE